MSQSTWAYPVNSWADLPGAIALAEQVGAIGNACLMRALAVGRIAYLPVLPDTSAMKLKAFIRATVRRPSVVLIGDDDGFDRGPDGWALARRAVCWARGVLIHGAGAEVHHYEAAIEAAEIAGRVLVIECSSATLGAWAALVGAAAHRPGTLLIYPRGGVHPVMPDRRRVQ